ncbi:hypothetical protein ABT336_06100, partial [Micromonospora sp. NPDC000207]|uniref:hypothetical protein n=1 Tax=Micromonospora sp. NPDC000207 TaxID=3154246 RepID=UPI0033291A41
MANPEPDTPPARRLVWAPDEVRVRVDPPRIGTGRLVTTAALTGLVFTWPPAFLVLTAATLAAPSLTDGAGIGATARWAAQIAVLVAVGAVVTVLRRRDTPPGAADP